MSEFLATMPIPGEGTFFCTQLYKSLEATTHELAPHPHLGEGQDWRKEMRAKRAEFPRAIGWRSHSCIFSHLLAQEVAQLGYTYVSTNDNLELAGIAPHRHCWGVWQMPIYYMDNLDFSRKNFWQAAGGAAFNPALIERALTDDGVYVFDFHPVHLLLNTPSPEYYLEKRAAFKSGAPISELACAKYGTRWFYEDLLLAMARHAVRSHAMGNALHTFLQEKVPT